MDDKVSIERAHRVKLDDLISQEQIEVIRNITEVGEYVNFQKGETPIEGTVVKKFEFVFLLDSGHQYSWVDYIVGSNTIKNYLRKYHPVSHLIHDGSLNYHRMKPMRFSGHGNVS